MLVAFHPFLLHFVNDHNSACLELHRERPKLAGVIQVQKSIEKPDEFAIFRNFEGSELKVFDTFHWKL